MVASLQKLLENQWSMKIQILSAVKYEMYHLMYTLQLCFERKRSIYGLSGALSGTMKIKNLLELFIPSSDSSFA